MAGAPAPLVVETGECDYEMLCARLRDILSDLNYPTHECHACGWIAHEDHDAWEACVTCGVRFCSGCADEARTDDGSASVDPADCPLICEDCDAKRPK